MIKRLIFDIDNTLIEWKDEYWESLNKALDELKIEYQNDDIKKLIKAVDDYENLYPIYNKQFMLDLMKEYSSLDIDITFIDTWLKYWFRSSQVKRLEKTGLKKYFKEIYCTDECLIKPYPDSYLKAINDKKIEECIMIGDSIKCDVIEPINMGMKSIWYNPNKEESSYKSFTNYEELKEIL